MREPSHGGGGREIRVLEISEFAQLIWKTTSEDFFKFLAFLFFLFFFFWDKKKKKWGRVRWRPHWGPQGFTSAPPLRGISDSFERYREDISDSRFVGIWFPCYAQLLVFFHFPPMPVLPKVMVLYGMDNTSTILLYMLFIYFSR